VNVSRAVGVLAAAMVTLAAAVTAVAVSPTVLGWASGADAAVTITAATPAARVTRARESTSTALTTPRRPSSVPASIEGPQTSDRPLPRTPRDTTAAAPSAAATASVSEAVGTPTTTIVTRSASVEQLAPARVSPPASVEIAGTEVRGFVVPTAVDATTGELAIPDDPTVVGWYQFGPSPGQPGSAVLAGHLDWHRRPGAFHRLGGVALGSIVTIQYADGSSRRFQVVDNTLVPKQSLPVTDVFDRTGLPTLRLITCGGTFDSRTHHYRSNVVVTAVPID
jgi:hypothetical protein